jgi:hypothetical protein
MPGKSHRGILPRRGFMGRLRMVLSGEKTRSTPLKQLLLQLLCHCVFSVRGISARRVHYDGFRVRMQGYEYGDES